MNSRLSWYAVLAFSMLSVMGCYGTLKIGGDSEADTETDTGSVDSASEVEDPADDPPSDTGSDIPPPDTETEPDVIPDALPDTTIDPDVPPDTGVDTSPDVEPDGPPPPVICEPVTIVDCGETISAANDDPGHTTGILGNGCSTNEWTGPEMAYEFTFTDDLRVTFEVRDLGEDLDLFVFGSTAGFCDPGVCLDDSTRSGSRDEEARYTGTAGETVYVLLDGWDGAVSDYTLEVTCVVPEDCDDGIDNDGDGATDCDDGECRWVLPCYEDVCTDGIDNDEDGPVDCDDFDCMASPDCTDTCAATFDIVCGEDSEGDTSISVTPGGIDRWDCSLWEETGPEHIYSFTASADREVTARIFDHTVDLDVFVLEDDGSGCNNVSCITFDNNTAVFDATAGTTYYIVVDGYRGVSGYYHLEVDCI